MGRFTVIPTNTFDGLQMDAGVLLNRFDPANPAIVDDYIICATTGGVNPSCVPTFSDLGDDVDNVPVNMKELKHLDSWEVTLSTTSLGTTPELIRMALGCADIDSQNESKIIPRASLKQTDFGDIWWVGDRADGGFVAIQLKNALSTGGFSLQTTKNGKGTIALTITGHVSINAQDEVPMVIYSCDPEEVTAHTVTLNLLHVTATDIPTGVVEDGSAIEGTITAEDGYEIANVIVSMGGEDITDSAYDESDGSIAIASVTGDVWITATAAGV